MADPLLTCSTLHFENGVCCKSGTEIRLSFQLKVKARRSQKQILSAITSFTA
jgi:hypothetical protein